MDRAHSEKLYERIGQASAHWREKAKQLRFSAGVVFDGFMELVDVGRTTTGSPERSTRELGLMHSSMLLLGCAMENRIKAVLMADDPTRLNGGALKRWSGNGHDLIGLISLPPCDRLILTEVERDLLMRLGESIVWAGRYPIPKRAEAFYRSQSEEKVRLISTDFDAADLLFARLDDLMDEIAKARSRGEQ